MTWGEILVSPLQSAWIGVITFLPKLIAALIVLIVGWIIAVAVGKLVTRILKFLWIDQLLEKLNIKEAVEKSGLKFDVSKFVGWLVKWFLIIIVLVTTANILGLTEVTILLNRILFYIPNVVVAVVILFFGILFGTWAYKLVRNAAKAAKLVSADFLAGVAKWSIIVFCFLAALTQLQIAPRLIQTLFTGFVAMLAIAGGLAFGLGGKDWAAGVIEQLKKDLSSKE